MTVFSPYFYCWANGNTTDYIVDTLIHATQKLGKFNAATMAFVIADANGGIWSSFLACVPDMKKFIDSGGHLTISCGGANGPFLENSMNEDEQFTCLLQLLQNTGCRSLDFDVEGSAISNTTSIQQRNNVIVRLQEVFPGLCVSFTLPVNAAEYGSLSGDGIALLQNAKNTGVNVSVVRLMVMDLYSAADTKNWGTETIAIIESAKKQISQIWPSLSDSQLYASLGVIFMAGVNDDKSVFTLNDATVVTNYVREKQLGVLSFWALQRDQSKQGGLAVSTQITQKDFDFYNICVNASIGVSPPVVTPVITPSIVPIVTPVTTSDTWQVSTAYKIGDHVLYKGKTYVCELAHTSIASWSPDMTSALWQISTTTGIIYPSSVQVPFPTVSTGTTQVKMTVTVTMNSSNGTYTTTVSDVHF